ncbi:MAG: signal peptidase I [Candidatus Daviesbacteria bacterium]|nr:signal peptidase I [Candidatus Daviesbacteria bacterium]
MKKAGKILYGIVLITLILVAGLTAFSALTIRGSYKLMIVQSGSMEPFIKTGSIVVIKPEDNYQIGDVITFKDPGKPKITVTHRINEIQNESGMISFITKGDANKSSDAAKISKNQILGKEILSIPWIGYLINFAKTSQGLIILVIIPSVVIVYSEILNIKKEAQRLIKERKSRKLTLKEKIEEQVGEEIIAVEEKINKVVKK